MGLDWEGKIFKGYPTKIMDRNGRGPSKILDMEPYLYK
jgi:hypothetical protein